MGLQIFHLMKDFRGYNLRTRISSVGNLQTSVKNCNFLASFLVA